MGARGKGEGGAGEGLSLSFLCRRMGEREGREGISNFSSIFCTLKLALKRKADATDDGLAPLGESKHHKSG